jgi:transposase-like protein
MPKKSPSYDLATQRSAVEQVIVHRRPVAQVARQLRCSPQSVKNWIEKHRSSITASAVISYPPSPRQSPLAFLPIQVETPSTVPNDKIELITKNGLILRFPIEISSEILCGIIRQLESISC